MVRICVSHELEEVLRVLVEGHVKSDRIKVGDVLSALILSFLFLNNI
jgi:hypothetical protein